MTLLVAPTAQGHHVFVRCPHTLHRVCRAGSEQVRPDAALEASQLRPALDHVMDAVAGRGPCRWFIVSRRPELTASAASTPASPAGTVQRVRRCQTSLRPHPRNGRGGDWWLRRYQGVLAGFLVERLGASSTPCGQTTVPASASTRACLKKSGSLRGSNTPCQVAAERSTSPTVPSSKSRRSRCSRSPPPPRLQAGMCSRASFGSGSATRATQRACCGRLSTMLVRT